MLEDRRFAVAAFVLLVLFWGSTFTVMDVGLGYTSPILFAGMRTLLCGAGVGILALAWGGKANFGRNWPVYLLLAAFNVAGFMGLQTLAVFYMPSGSAAVVIYLQPILVGFLSYLILAEPLSVAKVVGLLLGFSGVAAVSAGSLFDTSASATPLGVAFGAVAAFSWALGTVYFKLYGERLSTLWAVAAPFLIGGVCLTTLGFALESFSEVSWTGTYIASLLYTGLVGTGLAWILWLGLVRAGEASRVSAYIFFTPLVAVLLGALFLGEPLTPFLALGAALVVIGIYLVNRQPAGYQSTKDPKEDG